MNPGIVASEYATPAMPAALLGVPTAVEPVDAYGYDADARRYIRRVEAADRQPLELGVRTAINTFVVGLKNDGLWDSLRSSCILMGARTLSGALQQLGWLGVAPQAVNFVSSDYNRRTGLLASPSASNKRINTRVFANQSFADNNHAAVWVQTISTQQFCTYFGSQNSASLRGHFIERRQNEGLYVANGNNIFGADRLLASATTTLAGFMGFARNSAEYFGCVGGRTSSSRSTTRTATDIELAVFGRNFEAGFDTTSPSIGAAIAFYSAGSFLDLERLERRIATLVQSIQVVVP